MTTSLVINDLSLGRFGRFGRFVVCRNLFLNLPSKGVSRLFQIFQIFQNGGPFSLPSENTPASPLASAPAAPGQACHPVKASPAWAKRIQDPLRQQASKQAGTPVKTGPGAGRATPVCPPTFRPAFVQPFFASTGAPAAPPRGNRQPPPGNHTRPTPPTALRTRR